VSELSLVKIDPEIPLEIAAPVGCGVPTGWGSAVNAARVQPGDVIIVMGAGGVGMNAVQGAASSGARRVIAAGPVAFKREAAPTFGATDVTDVHRRGRRAGPRTH
jgi:Zn-dependent alcohol dehydrogenase